MTGDVDVSGAGPHPCATSQLTAHAVLDRTTAAGGVATATTWTRASAIAGSTSTSTATSRTSSAVATMFAAAAGDVSGHIRPRVDRPT